ncbi:hypothetical protein WN48_04201 [Eufriesea mexicana]|uniref:Uncharacterized protein n=1 Tax=Eufriesea mexicana TaxID=516756 RepID=A0A310SA07_9HYME|nr:hypothetical protein WN48_04201 [Eufriesea mexicana]
MEGVNIDRWESTIRIGERRHAHKTKIRNGGRGACNRRSRASENGSRGGGMQGWDNFLDGKDEAEVRRMISGCTGDSRCG